MQPNLQNYKNVHPTGVLCNFKLEGKFTKECIDTKSVLKINQHIGEHKKVTWLLNALNLKNTLYSVREIIRNFIDMPSTVIALD